MPDSPKPRVAIVDYGMGNLFSVRQACEHVGLDAVITESPEDVAAAAAVILPGIGGFPHGMATLHRLGMVPVLREFAQSMKPLMGICLGMQMLMSESFEFGRHEGLGIIPGQVIRFDAPVGPSGPLKVPQVCWNTLSRRAGPEFGTGDRWARSLLNGLPDGSHMYFVHSFHVVPEDSSVTLATTTYGNIPFCSALQRENIFAIQCHPERSGPAGLRVYANLAHVLGSHA